MGFPFGIEWDEKLSMNCQVPETGHHKVCYSQVVILGGVVDNRISRLGVLKTPWNRISTRCAFQKLGKILDRQLCTGRIFSCRTTSRVRLSDFNGVTLTQSFVKIGFLRRKNGARTHAHTRTQTQIHGGARGEYDESKGPPFPTGKESLLINKNYPSEIKIKNLVNYG